MTLLVLCLVTKISACSDSKVFSDNKVNATNMMFPVFDKVENIVGKGENAGYQHFLLFPQCFQKASPPGSVFTNHSLERSLSYSPEFSMYRSI